MTYKELAEKILLFSKEQRNLDVVCFDKIQLKHMIMSECVFTPMLFTAEISADDIYHEKYPFLRG